MTWCIRDYFLYLSLKGVSKNDAKVLRNSSVVELEGEDDVVYKGLLSLKGVSKNNRKVLRNSSVVELEGEDDLVYKRLLSLKGVSKINPKVLHNSSVVELEGEDDVVYKGLLSLLILLTKIGKHVFSPKKELRFQGHVHVKRT